MPLRIIHVVLHIFKIADIETAAIVFINVFLDIDAQIRGVPADVHIVCFE